MSKDRKIGFIKEEETAASQGDKLLVASTDPDKFARQLQDAAAQRSGSGSPRAEFDKDALQTLAAGVKEDADLLRVIEEVTGRVLRPDKPKKDGKLGFKLNPE